MPHDKKRSVDAARFAMVPRADISRSAFDAPHLHKTTFNSGLLIPIFIDEVLPGDSWRVRMTAFARLATALVPIMDNLVLESFFFYCPNRLLWDNWTRFMGEQTSPSDSTVFVTPRIDVTTANATLQSLYDYMGITLNNAAGPAFVSIQAMPFRMYNRIWNEFFRDEDLDTPLTMLTDDGPDPPGTYVTTRVRKRHDYFTSARPWPQKPMNVQTSAFSGEPAIPGGRMSYPQSGAPVHGLGIAPGAASFGPVAGLHETGGRVVNYGDAYPSTVSTFYAERRGGEDYPEIRVLINDLRTASVIQALLERNARGGTRYAEIVRAHWGVVSPDARLQRPEYLGGGRSFVNVNPVVQQSATGVTGSTTPQGYLTGIGTTVASNHGFSQSFTEHGWIMGLIAVRSDLSYQHGINRMWWRRTQFDFYWPGLEGLGEQAILSREIWADGTGGATGDTSVFGYQERWSEYKYKPSRISGMFRSSRPTPLDMWHLSQHFVARPVLNDLFVMENAPVDRVTQTSMQAAQQFLLDALFDCRMVRAMPMRSIPGVTVRL